MMGILVQHWHRRSTFAASSRLRVEVRPPSLRHKPSSLWQRLMFWVLAPAPQDAAPPLNRLPAVRADFNLCLADLAPEHASGLVDRIERARSLRDLWHLRPEVLNFVALHHSQTEAETRLTRLNRHFPTRAPRSGFAPL
jgi:hypothetical protein